MTVLDNLRWSYNHPIYLNSAYRCREHNKAVGGVDSSPHTKGIAVDIRCSGQDAHRILSLAARFGFTGIGVSQKGDHSKRFIHLDIDGGETRPWVWSY